MSTHPSLNNRPSTASSTSPQWKWWVPGAGINRNVITSEIQQYLGQDALVKPGKGIGENQGVEGFWISAYRNLTSAMLQDLKDQTIRYEKQKEASGRFQEPHPDSRNPASRPTPPLNQGSSAYPPPPSTMSPYGQDQGYGPPRQGPPPQGYDNPGYAGPVDHRDPRDPREIRDPRDPYYQQTGQMAYPAHGQPNVSPHTPQYANPHYPPGGPTGQVDGGAYGYGSPPVQYPNQPFPQGPMNGQRRDQYPPGYSGPPQPGYGYPVAQADNPVASSGYSPYSQGSHPAYR